MFTPTRVKNKSVKSVLKPYFGIKATGGEFMKRIIGILLCLLLAIALGASARGFREAGVSMAESRGEYAV